MELLFLLQLEQVRQSLCRRLIWRQDSAMFSVTFMICSPWSTPFSQGTVLKYACAEIFVLKFQQLSVFVICSVRFCCIHGMWSEYIDVMQVRMIFYFSHVISDPMSDAVLSSTIKIHIYLGFICFESIILFCGLSKCLVHPRSSVHCKKCSKDLLSKYHLCFVGYFQPFVLPADTANSLVVHLKAASCLSTTQRSLVLVSKITHCFFMFTVNDKMLQQCLILPKWATVALHCRDSCLASVWHRCFARTLLQAIFTPRISGTRWQIVKIFHMQYCITHWHYF